MKNVTLGENYINSVANFEYFCNHLKFSSCTCIQKPLKVFVYIHVHMSVKATFSLMEFTPQTECQA